MALTAARRLEAELGVVPDDLRLTDAAYVDRVALWEELAGEREKAEPFARYEHVKALLVRSWIMALMRRSDEFEAVGDIKRKTDILGRVAELERLEKVALRNAGLLTEVTGPVVANPAPDIGGWGVEYER